LLYFGTPLLAFGSAAALYQAGDLWFWRTLAYVAVLHFVRQQAGWVALYRARAGERDRLGRLVDAAAIYAATLYPLAYWHAHLPRRFHWFWPGDFVTLPALVARGGAPLYVLALTAYAVRSAIAWRAGRANPGKDVVVATTAACWYGGIVAENGDYAFTVTNVLIHGVPYFALIYWYGRRRLEDRPERPGAYRLLGRGPLGMLAALWLAAYLEELVWDRGVWHDRAWLFGGGWPALAHVRFLLIPLLAVPQLVHYVLDGFVWRRRGNPQLSLVDR
jgi:hypothetical protein